MLIPFCRDCQQGRNEDGRRANLLGYGVAVKVLARHRIDRLSRACQKRRLHIHQLADGLLRQRMVTVSIAARMEPENEQPHLALVIWRTLNKRRLTRGVASRGLL